MIANESGTEHNLKEITSRLRAVASERYAAVSRRFFKTGPGEYAEGDQFIGVRVPILRKIAKAHMGITIRDSEALLCSTVHEERFLALLFLMRHYAKGDECVKNRIFQFYLNNTRFINNWDLVDLSAHHIVGHYLTRRNKAPLYNLAVSGDLWERRISVISTFCYIRRDNFKETLKISKLLLNDREDLIHKAVGWMLREVGKRDFLSEENFLKSHYRNMPRTMLRYAIEKFPEALRKDYLNGQV